MKILPLVLAVGCACAGGAARADWSDSATDQMADLSLEQLSGIVVSSVSRQETSLASAPASVFIINASDIRRSGARTLPEALRLAPNLHVARADARSYAISARGFNSVFSNKLLVLIDGRSVYSPLFSGVYWDAQEVVMEDIARIEVISGPGATIWGVNAVNGVINVITHGAAATQGGLLKASAGAHERGQTFRYGGRLDNGTWMRVYAKNVEIDDSINAAGTSLDKGLRRRQAGFRADMEVARGQLTVSGDAYQGHLKQIDTRGVLTTGANLVARYQGKTAGGGDLRVHAIVDHTQRDQSTSYSQRLNTAEVEAQHGLRLGSHSIVWGGGYRHSWDRITNSPAVGFLPPSLDMSWANLFAQDEFALTEQLRATAGMKVEYNHYTGNELLPNLRLAWSPDQRHLVWGSLARTVRAPSRSDRDLYSPSSPINLGGTMRYFLAGGPDFQSEVARVAELGYRAQPHQQLSWSATLWWADYDRLRTLEPQRAAASIVRNLGEGQTRGIEMWARWTVTPRWRVDAGAVVQSIATGISPDSRDVSSERGVATNDPRRRFTLRSSHELSAASQLEWSLRYVGALPEPHVPSYHELDINWVWTPRPDIDIILSGQNLLHKHHAEFGEARGTSVVQRALMLSAAYRF